MIRLILTIRPEPGSTATVAAGREAGLDIEACPLSEIRPRTWQAPPPETIDGLLIGSANAFRHGGAGLLAFRSKPVFAVGAATAREAEKAGFTVGVCGEGSLQPLLDRLAPPLRLLRLTGEEHVSVTPPAGIAIEIRVGYESVPLPLPARLAQRLGAGGALVLLHSAAAARHFAGECDRLEAGRTAIRLAALGPRIAAAAGTGWQAVRSAAEPSEAALLALVRDMCHESPPA